MRLEMSFRLPYELTPKKRWVLASCPVLDVHSQGENESAAIANLREALQLFLEGCIEMGTLEQVLKESGFQIADGRSDEPGQPTIDVELSMSAPGQVLRGAA